MATRPDAVTALFLVIMRCVTCAIMLVPSWALRRNVSHEHSDYDHNSSLLSPVSFCSLSYAASTFSLAALHLNGRLVPLACKMGEGGSSNGMLEYCLQQSNPWLDLAVVQLEWRLLPLGGQH